MSLAPLETLWWPPLAQWKEIPSCGLAYRGLQVCPLHLSPLPMLLHTQGSLRSPSSTGCLLPAVSYSRILAWSAPSLHWCLSSNVTSSQRDIHEPTSHPGSLRHCTFPYLRCLYTLLCYCLLSQDHKLQEYIMSLSYTAESMTHHMHIIKISMNEYLLCVRHCKDFIWIIIINPQNIPTR